MTKNSYPHSKKIFDAIHGFIKFDEFEKKVIDSISFQRLHYIHQLGIAYLVYPGATNSRFEHSLGVMELSTQIYTRLCKTVRPEIFNFVPQKGSYEYLYWKKILRLAALCHDLGHLPFSHVAEQDVLSGKTHEYLTVEIIRCKYLRKLWEKLEKRSLFKSLKRNIEEDIIKIAIGEKKLKKICPEIKFSPWEKIISSIITCDFFGADRIDYLLRDAKCTGIAYGLFDYQQLIEMLRILPVTDKSEDLALGLDENGLESCEALLLARHFMYKRVYQYPHIKAYNFHLRRFMAKIFKDANFIKNPESLLNTSDVNVIAEFYVAANDVKHTGHLDAKKIIYKKDLFIAIALPKHFDKKKLEDFKKKNNLKDDQISWEFIKPEDHDNFFPISKKGFRIESSSKNVSLLNSFPENITNWAYISPEFEMPLLNEIQAK